jgi:predicted RNA-binding Zn-ribbon protein involved in translation (DUF1610 family)
MSALTCPNCGDAVAPALTRIKMMTCPSCGTTLILEDASVRLAGREGVMHDVPMLIGLGDGVTCGRETVEILGHARFSYGRGFWDEFWGVTGTGEPRWVSVDEGDVVYQSPLPPADYPRHDGRFRAGQTLTTRDTSFDIVEIDSAECVALKGAFDEELQVGETYRFVNAQSDRGWLLSGEIWDGGEAWFVGDWYDPYEITVTKGPGA